MSALLLAFSREDTEPGFLTWARMEAMRVNPEARAKEIRENPDRAAEFEAYMARWHKRR